MSEKIDLTGVIAEWAIPFAAKRARYKTLYGGRSSSKTWTVAHILIAEAATTKIRVACLREFQSSIKVSAKPALEVAIRRLGLSHAFDISDHYIKGRNGSFFFFRGMERNREEIRGWEGVNRVWVEEAQRMSDETARVLIPTIREPDAEMWFTWNPHYRTDWVWRRFIMHPRSGDLVQKVNWHDNGPRIGGPPVWFPIGSEIERQADLRDNPDLYAHIWEGEPDDSGSERKVLPWHMLQDCVDAHKQGLHARNSSFVECGLDVADTGSAWNAFCVRSAGTIHHIEKWRSPIIGVTARRAHRLATEWNADRVFYDAGGVGAGVKSYFAEFDRNYAVRPELFGGAVKGPDLIFSYRILNRDFFARRNAQLGWAMRLRAERTRKLLDGEEVDPDSCLFIDHRIPRLEEFMAQLSQPAWREGVTEKTELLKREDDEPSPDLYDAAVLAFARDSQNGLRAR